MFTSTLILFVLFTSCSDKQMDNRMLCLKFIELNKSKNFDNLYDVAIGGRRIKSIFDKSSNQYEYVFNSIDVYDNDSDEFLMLPFFKKDATLVEKESSFKNTSQEVKSYLSKKYKVGTDPEILNAFIDFVEKIYSEYYNIETPSELGFKNVQVEGNPRLGRFITFTLNEKCKVYYLADTSTLTEYWRTYFDEKLNKIDEKWYYEVIAK